MRFELSVVADPPDMVADPPDMVADPAIACAASMLSSMEQLEKRPPPML